MIEVHQEEMSTRDKKEARRILEVEFEQTARTNPSRPTRPADAPESTSRMNRREAFGANLTTRASFPALPTTRTPVEASTSKELESYMLFQITNPDSATLE